MIENDTVKLLRECDAGIRMGVGSIDEVLGETEDPEFKRMLQQCRSRHETLQGETTGLLNQYHDSGKSPNPMAVGMSWMKTNWRMLTDRSDKTIADLMTDGCNMGVKSLARYLNQYEAASEKSKDIAKRLIHLEEGLTADIRKYL